MVDGTPSAKRWRHVVRDRQAAWIRERGFAVNEQGWLCDVFANLYRLSEAGRSEFAAGSGNELGAGESPGKLAAPWSSSALAANVFEYWRDQEMRPLADALGLRSRPTRLVLEARFQTGFSPRAPANLDVVLEGVGEDARVAIESKFCEPFDGGPNGTRKDDFKDAYLDTAREQDWNGLRHLLELAHAVVARSKEFFRLDVPQLTKHCIALRRERRPFELILLWYSPPADYPETREMQQEINQFSEVIARDGVRFRALTYQDIFARLQASAASHADYLAYLSSRYFPSPLT